MAEQERVRENLREEEVDPKLYYDYEGEMFWAICASLSATR